MAWHVEFRLHAGPILQYPETSIAFLSVSVSRLDKISGLIFSTIPALPIANDVVTTSLV
jgi:hypothetical protein